MALVKTDNVISQTRGFSALPLLRQLGLMAGLAASVAIGVAAVLWSQSPSYSMLYSNLSEKDTGEIADSLQKSGIPYKLSADSSSIMVDSAHVHDARLKLASQGLPKGGGVGFEMLDEQKGFGVSQFMENARYHRALEGELARTISSLDTVRGARVHLAIPKQTAFVRERKKPTASVTVDLYPGRSMEEGQIAAISHMVAASIPNLDVGQVTIIDQKGRLLTLAGSSEEMRLSSTQFDYRKRLEDYYIKRIEDILSPIVGVSGVRAQVAADIDFTTTEQTLESFNPDLPAVRSEQTIEESSGGTQGATGIPGSLSNQPPEAAVAANGETRGAIQNGSSTRRSTRNYELDRTISHVRNGGSSVRHISVAVVVDDRLEVNEDGEQVRTTRSPEEIERITGLVKEAIGFNTQRGDSVNVINAPFSVPPVPEPLPEPSFFDNPSIWNGLKQALAGGVVLFLMFGVLKPVLRELAAKGEVLPPVLMSAQHRGGGIQEDQLSLTGGGGQAMNSGFENNLNTARTLATQDPKRVAQVVKNWVANDA